MSFTSTPIIHLLSAPVQPLLLPASIGLHSDTETWCDLYQPVTPLPPTPAVIRLPARSAWLRFDASRVKFEGPYQPTNREMTRFNDLAAWLVQTKHWNGHTQRVTIHDVDLLRYVAFGEMDIRITLSEISVRKPVPYRDTPKSGWEARQVKTLADARAYNGTTRISPFAPRISVSL